MNLPNERYPAAETASTLLAVDLGVRTGLALFGRDGRLRWCRSANYGSATRLRRAAQGLLRGLPGLAHLVLEGGGPLARLWEREALRLGVPARRLQAPDWRESLLYPRERRTGADAKRHAEGLANNVARWSGARVGKRLSHDGAEAVLLGLWAVVELGWLTALPDELRRGS